MLSLGNYSVLQVVNHFEFNLEAGEDESQSLWQEL